jgi:UDP-glucose 4-epimerase
MKFAITGGTGFIGSNLCKRLIEEKHDVVILEKIKQVSQNRLDLIKEKIDIVNLDLTNLESVKKELKNIDVVAHFSANASTQTLHNQTDVNLKDDILTTYNILESMRLNNIKKIIFPSAAAVYGIPKKIPTSEDTGMLLPVSLYGSAKLASEAMISAFCNLFDMQSWIFRLGNVVGPNMNRGVIKDLIVKLKKNQSELEILGNGNQEKDVIYIDDCIDGILFVLKNAKNKVNLFNLSSGTTVTVKDIVKIILNEMNLKKTKLKYSEQNIGWKGDVPQIHFDISKIQKLGWTPKFNANESIKKSVRKTI